jgi:preprotein translocase subunit YajC
MFDCDIQVLTPFLAQAEGPPAPGGGATAPVEGQPGGTPPKGGPGGSPRAGGMDFLFPMLLLFLVMMILFTVLGQRREKKKRQTLLGSIKKHDRVQTVGGVIGSIVEIKPDTVVLKVDESSNIRMTFARSAIQHVLTNGPEDDGAGTGGPR